MGERWTETDIPDQTGRTFVVTGASAGLGQAASKFLAGRGATVVMGVRDLPKAQRVRDEILVDHPDADLRLQEVDMADLASIRSAADALAAEHPRIDVLINNAGVMYTPKQTTVDGFEMQFGTNHLGAFALTGLLLPLILPVEGSRVVAVASMAHDIRAAIHFDDLQWEKRYDRVAAYGQSKLANLMFTYALQRRLDAAEASTIAVAGHPGLTATELTRHLPCPIRVAADLTAPLMAQSPERGCLPIVRAATDSGVAGGEYYGPDGFKEIRGWPEKVRSSRQSRDESIQELLWSQSEALTGVIFSV